ncbi:hypothetical protein [Robertmurraya sp. Marseille-Q9965]
MKSSGEFSMLSKVFLAGIILVSGIPMNNAFAATGTQNTVDVKKIAGYVMGTPNEEGGVAEIVKYNSDNEKF